MAALCIRPTDCLPGRAFFGAHRGVRAAPAPPPRRPMQQQQKDGQIGATVSQPVPRQSRAARGRTNGRQRGRRSPPPAVSPPHKRVMENVVILKRGEKTPAEVTAAMSATPPAAGQSGAQPEKTPETVAAAAGQRGAQGEEAETVAAAADKHNTEAEKAEAAAAVEHRGAQLEEDDEPVAATGQSGALAEEAEPVAAADQRGPGTPAKKAEAAEHPGADAAMVAHQSVPSAKEKDKPVAAAAEQSGEQEKNAEATPPAVYSGPSFVVAPEPRALPIPVFLLKPRSAAARLRARDDHALPTAAAA